MADFNYRRSEWHSINGGVSRGRIVIDHGDGNPIIREWGPGNDGGRPGNAGGTDQRFGRPDDEIIVFGNGDIRRHTHHGGGGPRGGRTGPTGGHDGGGGPLVQGGPLELGAEGGREGGGFESGYWPTGFGQGYRPSRRRRSQRPRYW